MFRNTKISAERHLKTNCLNSDVIQARVSSGLELAADVTSLHSSRRTFGAPRSLSARDARYRRLVIDRDVRGSRAPARGLGALSPLVR